MIDPTPKIGIAHDVSLFPAAMAPPTTDTAATHNPMTSPMPNEMIA
jgi:hypothetical protein